MQETLRKCADNGKGGSETYMLKTCGSWLTATEKTLRGEGMCTNSGRIHGDTVHKMHRQWKKMGTTMIICSEMRTEGTSRLEHLLVTFPAHTRT